MNLQITKVFRILAKGVLVLTGLFLLGFLGWTVYRGVKFRPYKVRVTNVTDSAFTVSWVTDSPMPGIVYYGEKDTFLPGPLAWLGKKKAVDDRDFSDAQSECVRKFNKEASKNRDENFTIDASGFDCNDVKVWKYGKYFTHHVTVQNLEAEKEYFFRVGDGVLSYGKNSGEFVVGEIEGADDFLAKTSPSFKEVLAPNPAFGTTETVLQTSDGYYSYDRDYDSMVFLSIKDPDGLSFPVLSSVANKDGGWSMDLANLRDEEGNPVSMEGNTMIFMPQSANHKSFVFQEFEYGGVAFPIRLPGNVEEDVKGENVDLASKLISKLTYKSEANYDAGCKATANYGRLTYCGCDGVGCTGDQCYRKWMRGSETCGWQKVPSGCSAKPCTCAGESCNPPAPTPDPDPTPSCPIYGSPIIGDFTTVCHQSSCTCTNSLAKSTSIKCGDKCIKKETGCTAGLGSLSDFSSICRYTNCSCTHPDSDGNNASCGNSCKRKTTIPPAVCANTGPISISDFTTVCNQTNCECKNPLAKSLTVTCGGKCQEKESTCYAVKVSGSTRSCVETNCEESTAFQSYQNCKNSLAANGNECYWFSPSSNKCYKADCTVRSDYREPTCGGREGFWKFDPDNTQKPCFQIPLGDYDGTYHISHTFDNCEYRRRLINNAKAVSASSVTAIQVNTPTDAENPPSLQEISRGGELGICNGKIQSKSVECEGNGWQNPLDEEVIENLPKIINCLDTKTGEVSSYQVANSLYTSCPEDKEKQLDAVTFWSSQPVGNYYCCSVAIPAPGSSFLPSAPQMTCKLENQVSWSNCFSSGMGGTGTSLTKKFVGRLSANEVVNDKGNGVFYFPNSGMVEFETQNNLKMELFANQKTPYFFYVERNGISGYQPPKDEKKIELTEDLIYSETGFVVSLSQTTSAQNISLKQGINIISFNFHPSQGKESKSLTSSDFLLLANAVDRNISRISYFAAGQWNGGTSYDFENNETKGVPFDLVFGKGYVVVAEQDCTISIPGYNIESPVPIAFSSGWNLVGVHGQKEAYTAKTFIESINTIEGLKANNVTWWPTSRGMYQGYQLQNGQEYGQDFPISPINGYFVRIAEFTPKEDTCKSLIWNPSGEMNGECGSNN